MTPAKDPTQVNITCQGSYQMMEGWEPLGNTGAQPDEEVDMVILMVIHMVIMMVIHMVIMMVIQMEEGDDNDDQEGDDNDDEGGLQDYDEGGDQKPAERHHAGQVGQSNQLTPNLHIKDYQEYA